MRSLIATFLIMIGCVVYANTQWQGVSVHEAGWLFWVVLAMTTSPLWFGLPMFVRWINRPW